MAFIQIAVFGGGTDDKIHLLIIAFYCIGFYVCTLETYHTGTLTLGIVNGPTEGILLLCLVMIYSGIYGPAVWKTPLFYSSLLRRDLLYYECLYVAAIAALILYLIPSSLLAVYSNRKHHQHVYKSKSPLSLSVYLVHLMPLFIYLGSFVGWAVGPFSRVWTMHPFLFGLAVSIVFGRIASKIILAHITKSEYPAPTIVLAPQVLGAVCANFFPG